MDASNNALRYVKTIHSPEQDVLVIVALAPVAFSSTSPLRRTPLITFSSRALAGRIAEVVTPNRLVEVGFRAEETLVVEPEGVVVVVLTVGNVNAKGVNPMSDPILAWKLVR